MFGDVVEGPSTNTSTGFGNSGFQIFCFCKFTSLNRILDNGPEVFNRIELRGNMGEDI